MFFNLRQWIWGWLHFIIRAYHYPYALGNEFKYEWGGSYGFAVYFNAGFGPGFNLYLLGLGVENLGDTVYVSRIEEFEVAYNPQF